MGDSANHRRGTPSGYDHRIVPRHICRHIRENQPALSVSRQILSILLPLVLHILLISEHFQNQSVSNADRLGLRLLQNLWRQYDGQQGSVRGNTFTAHIVENGAIEIAVGSSRDWSNAQSISAYIEVLPGVTTVGADLPFRDRDRKAKGVDDENSRISNAHFD